MTATEERFEREDAKRVLEAAKAGEVLGERFQVAYCLTYRSHLPSRVAALVREYGEYRCSIPFELGGVCWELQHLGTPLEVRSRLA